MTDPDNNQSNAIIPTTGASLQQEQLSEEDQRRFELNKKALFEAVKPTGVTHISVEFDGTGDSGQIESMLASIEGENESKPLPATAVPFQTVDHAGELRQENLALAVVVESLCYDLLDEHHGGWEDNLGGFGRFTFDVAAGTIHLEMNHRFEDYTTTETTF